MILAYNASFEKLCIQGLADAVPGLAAPLMAMADRIKDLLPVVRDHVYHLDFLGSFSLKAVLPALVPELTYGRLDTLALLRLLGRLEELAGG